MPRSRPPQSVSTAPAQASTTLWRSRIGALLWALCGQFFVLERIVMRAWTTPYSFAENYISDLGAATCADRPPGSDHLVCSPAHALMNTSFIFQGVLIVVGAWLLRDALPTGRLASAGRVLLSIAGPTLIMIGVWPEDINPPLHAFGAVFHLVTANSALIVLGLSQRRELSRLVRTPPAFGAISIALGAVGTFACILLGAVQASFWPLEQNLGALERTAGYPLPAWLIGTGIFFSIYLYIGVRSEPPTQPKP